MLIFFLSIFEFTSILQFNNSNEITVHFLLNLQSIIYFKYSYLITMTIHGWENTDKVKAFKCNHKIFTTHIYN